MHNNSYYTCDKEDKEIRRKKRYKTHVLVASHPEKNLTYVRTAIGSNLKVSGSEGAKRMLEKQNDKDYTFTADRGYDYEKVYRTCHEKHIKPNIKPQKYKSNRSTKRKQAIKNFKQDNYKQEREVVETIFGGLRNKGLLKTRYKEDENINKQSIINTLRHNIQTILKLKTEHQTYHPP